MEYKYIVSDPNILQGAPHIKDTTITVKEILDRISTGYTFNSILDITEKTEWDMLEECVKYASDCMTQLTPKLMIQKESEEFWKDIIYTEGVLDEQKVKNELQDYYFILEQLPKVYESITGGNMSKPMYYANDVINQADEHYQRHWKEYFVEMIEDMEGEIKVNSPTVQKIINRVKDL